MTTPADAGPGSASASPVCPACARSIRLIVDVPRVRVDRVQCLGLRQRSGTLALSGHSSRKGPPRSASRDLRLRADLRRLVEEHAEMLAAARQVATGDPVREYMAHLRSLSGRTVYSSSLLPSWQSRTRLVSARVPGSPQGGSRSTCWAVSLFAHWRGATLAARVDVELVREEGHRWILSQPGGTLARLWLRAHLNRRGPAAISRA